MDHPFGKARGDKRQFGQIPVVVEENWLVLTQQPVIDIKKEEYSVIEQKIDGEQCSLSRV